VVAPLVSGLIRHPQDQFCPDSLNLLNHSGVDASRLLEASQLIDTDLLALAVHHGGRLVSFDRRLSCEGGAGGRQALWLINA
jgi:predicted nucleic acid-binding protein